MSIGLILRRPDMTRSASFLFSIDEAQNLFVADALHRGQPLYTGVAFGYGPVSIELYALVSAALGNTPGTYLGTMAMLSAISAGMVAWLITRSADSRTALAFLVVALLPTMPLPGASVGGYTSSIYMPVERIVLIAGVMLWTRPSQRSWWRSIAIGAVLGLCQGVRFGSGAVAVAAVALVDQAAARRETEGAGLESLSASVLVLAGFFLAEGAWILWASLTLPGPFAFEFLWPLHMWETHRAGGAPTWPTFAGWRGTATQYLMPLTAAALGLLGLLRWSRTPARARTSAWDSQGSAVVLLVYFVLASLVYFRHEHHFRQFAWALVPAGAATAVWLGRTSRIVLLVMCAPALWPIASALGHRPSRDVVRLDVPRDYALFVSRQTAARVQFLDAYRAIGPVLFVPNGAGWLYGYRVEHVTRHSLFYSSAVVRPAEEPVFVRDAARAAAVIRCDQDGRPWPLPASAVALIEARFTQTISAAG